LNQLPQRPIACATGNPTASVSAAIANGRLSRRQTMYAPIAPPAIPPQMSRPPSHILNALISEPSAPKYASGEVST
jgi:hypothetical protein